MNLDHPVTVISGGGSGLGRALALALAETGYRVILTGRRAEKLRETVSLMDQKSDALILPCDISCSTAVEDLAHEVMLQRGPADILINNAGVFPSLQPMHEMSVSLWDETMATNLRGTFLMMRAFLPQMIQKNYGRILNISAPLKHYPGAAAYCASKCGIDALTKATALENKDRNILINAVEPPLMDTEMHRGGSRPEDIVPLLIPYLDSNDTTTRGRVVKLHSPLQK
ncbi:MAG: SDR family NAD(P)-dependent oxidoreductase [Candidatus Methylacidiphilales bacterium]